MAHLRNLLVAALAVPVLWSCSEVTAPPRPEDTSPGDNSLPGEQTPVVEPKYIPFAFGLTDNGAGAPNAAPYVTLSFNGGEASDVNVVVSKVSSAVALDGNSAEWSALPASTIPLQTRGEPVGLSEAEWQEVYQKRGFTPPAYSYGLTSATMKAAHDGQNLYLLVQWADSSESNLRDRLTYSGGAWARSTQNEDRLYFAFNISYPGFEVLGCSAACHMKNALTETDSTKMASHYRMHTEAVGEKVDVWSWRATTTNPMGRAEDGYWDHEKRKLDSAATASDFAVRNYTGGTSGAPIAPSFMAEGNVNASPAALYKAAANRAPLAVPYDGTGINAGTTLPGWVFEPVAAAGDDVHAVGSYANGIWTVELKRALVNSDSNDVQFIIE